MQEAIRVENISKKYRLGAPSALSLKESLHAWGNHAKRWVTRPWRKNDQRTRLETPTNTLWALRDVSLSVKPGEIVGIVGRNGNGKSTLLKILSRITPPTKGRVKIRGSVSSLLEVGTGFHPELSGKENIYLNGAIMGMTRRQIRAKLDEIVAFAEVEKFLDTPVKRYSSGMYVRLAFAVAAHLDPDILLVDEVLAVGDGAFQKKCLGKIQSVGASDRTVLFVSHNLPTVRGICTRAVLLDQGQVVCDGPTSQVLAQYHERLQSPRTLTNDALGWRLLQANGSVRVQSLNAFSPSGQPSWAFSQGDDVRIQIAYRVHEQVASLGVFLKIHSLTTGETVTTIRRAVHQTALSSHTEGQFELVLPKIPLRPGEYGLTLALGDALCEKRFDYLDEHQSLPWLSIRSDERDVLQLDGYFSIPALVNT